eukprot:g605.t1
MQWTEPFSWVFAYFRELNLKVCLNILREDWKPVLSISLVVYGLLYLFLEPNPGDPLNHEAAEVLRNNRGEFGRIVARTAPHFCGLFAQSKQHS